MADSASPSPCKVSLNGALRRFLIGRPAVWREFEDKIRTVYSLSPNVALDVHYRDDEDDEITLNTDNELEDVLAMHALFSQLPTVKFEVFTKKEEDASLSSSVVSTSTSTTATSSVIPSQYTPWSLNQLSPVEYSPVRSNDKRRTIYGSEQSDDVSLIDLEDGERLMDELQQMPGQDVEEPITYPQRDLEMAALQQELQRLEAIKIEAPVFISSILGAQPEETKGAEEFEEVEEVEEEEAEDANMTVAAAVVHYETLATRSQKSPTQLTSPTSPISSSSVTLPLIDFERDIASSEEPNEKPKEESKEEDANDAVEDPVEPELPSTTSTSTSTSERPYNDDDDRALMEQFQLLIKEFQEIIQNNPQLVALAGNIMTKVTLS
ncbi:MAG: hypothetical protein BYD32DRAFT_413933 [Podila humilis]|nr:MAG: hypothetical protein BYD32DRAFT_413933 [Podila humilis]